MARIVETLIFSSGILALLLGAGQLLRRAETRDATFGAVLVVVGLLQIAGAEIPPASEWHTAETRLLFHVHGTLKLLLAPLLYFLFGDLSGVDRQIRSYHLLHLLPAILFSPAVWLIERVLTGTNAATIHSEVIRYTVTLSTAFVACYIVLGVRHFDVKAIWSAPRGRPAIAHILALLCLVPALASWTFFLIRPERAHLVGPHLAGAGLLFVYVTLAERFPGLLQTIRTQSRKFGKSQLEGLDLADLSARLQTLMSEEQVYRDETLTLPRLAGLMELSVHQLSRLLNEHIGQNFATYVNGHRVAEARRLLVEQTDRTSLSIGMEVGFNSYTAFHSAFARIEGIPPGKFRRDHSHL